MTTLKIICAWCLKDMGEKDGEGVDGVTGGICKYCLFHHFPNQYQKIYGDKECKKE